LEASGLRAAPEIRSFDGLRGYLAKLHDACDRAAAASGGYRDFHCRLAGLDVRLRFAGPALVPFLTPALEHIRAASPSSRPALTLHVFDSESTGVAPPVPAWDDSVFLDGGRVHATIGDAVHAVFEQQRFSVHEPGSDTGLYWVEGPSAVRHHMGSPLVPILHLCLATHGVQIAHAAAVGDDRGCVLVIGPGGAGKSSTVLACLRSELRLLSDDYCLIGPEDPPLAHTLFSSARATEDTVARLRFLEPMVSRRPGEKPLCLLAEHVPGRLLARAPVNAVAIPRVAGRAETSLSPAPAGAVLGVLSLSTLSQLRGSGDAAMARLARAVRGVPSYYLDAGTDPAGVAEAMVSLVAA
jgi:hypothetical protein